MHTWQAPTETVIETTEHRVIEAMTPEEAVVAMNDAARDGWVHVATIPGVRGNAQLRGVTVFMRRPKTIVLSEANGE